MERSFAHVLERREVSGRCRAGKGCLTACLQTEQYAARNNSLLASMVTFTTIDLDNILDAERVLMDG